jgi:GNAT superfamily N-acetyltransferase
VSIEVRPAEAADGPVIAALAGQLGYDPAGVPGRLAVLVGRRDVAVLVAAIGGEVAGWVHVHDAGLVQVPPFAEVGGLVVAEARRGEGVGDRLLGAAEAWAAGRGHREIRLLSNAVRERAHGFYRARGYRVEKTSLTFLKDV